MYTPSNEAIARHIESLPEYELWSSIKRKNALEHMDTILGDEAPYLLSTLNGNHAALHGMRNPSMLDIFVSVFKLLVKLGVFEAGEKQIALWYAREDSLAPLLPLHQTWFRGFFPQPEDLDELKEGRDIGSACIWDFLFLGHTNPSQGWQVATYLFAHADLSESNRAAFREGFAPISGFERLAMLYKLDTETFSKWIAKIVEDIVKNSPELTGNFAKAWPELKISTALGEIAHLTVWRVGVLMWFFNMLAEIHGGAASPKLKTFVDTAIENGEVRLFEDDVQACFSQLEITLLNTDLLGDWNESTRHAVASIQKALTPQILSFLACGVLYGNVKAFDLVDLLFSLMCVLREKLIPGLQSRGDDLTQFIMEGPAFYGYPKGIHPHWMNFSTKPHKDPNKVTQLKSVICGDQ